MGIVHKERLDLNACHLRSSMFLILIGFFRYDVFNLKFGSCPALCGRKRDTLWKFKHGCNFWNIFIEIVVFVAWKLKEKVSDF